MNSEPSDPIDVSSEPARSFAEEGERKAVGLHRELIALLMANKKFWMIPILLLLAVFGILLILGATSAAPFIYTLF